VQWYSGHQTLPTTLWVANAVVSMGLLRGQLAGVISGFVLAAISIAARGLPVSALWLDSTMPALVVVGLAIGAASTTAKRTFHELRRAERAAAAAIERERLARQVHDGVLQVLSYVKRRGTEIGGPTAELAAIAGEQEVALRELISGATQTMLADDELVDLRPLLRTQASTAVSVSAPGSPVLIGQHMASELAAVVRSALSNVALHAGPQAHAYVLIEDLDDSVVVTVRDDGSGIAAGRLDQAEREGRMGVSRSILGRVADLGGAVLLETAPGAGTEWEITVPKSQEVGL
jgi:signal transduction histidine kinase